MGLMSHSGDKGDGRSRQNDETLTRPFVSFMVMARRVKFSWAR